MTAKTISSISFLYYEFTKRNLDFVEISHIQFSRQSSTLRSVPGYWEKFSLLDSYS